MTENFDDPQLPANDHPQKVRIYIKERLIPILDTALEDLLREVTAIKRRESLSGQRSDFSPLVWLSDYLRQYQI